TDAPGLIAALSARGIALAGASAMVLGAGGTARGAVWALCDAGARVSVWNRTPERALALCDELGGTAVERPVEADLLIQCTAAGMEAGSELPLVGVPLGSFQAVVDFVYTERGSALLAAAEAAGTATVDGLELLVRQGALSFEQFTGMSAPLPVMA
ncbi:MAG: shikimate dehydrogenase, partial [Solirubrobacterales bacterium]|nr:shikimate dehydrogenase [Solirubrobacterales bacterium]